MNIVLEAIRNRRSIRKYLSKPIKESELQAILEAGAYAPSAHNEQSWHFTVIRNKELLDTINIETKKVMAKQATDWVKSMGNNKAFHVFYHAPTVIIVSMKKDAISPLVDCSAAIENMLLAAHSINIGSCWIGLARYYFTLKKELPSLNIPKGYTPCYAVTLGYKDQLPTHAPPRKKDVVNFID